VKNQADCILAAPSNCAAFRSPVLDALAAHEIPRRSVNLSIRDPWLFQRVNDARVCVRVRKSIIRLDVLA
jgi:hypothetical protein